MLRYAAKNAADKGGKQVFQTIRSESTSAKKSGGIGKKLTVTVGLTGAAVGGTLGYAYIDPEFRKTLEEAVPQSKVLIDNVLGPPWVYFFLFWYVKTSFLDVEKSKFHH